jgi:hypothetical protein
VTYRGVLLLVALGSAGSLRDPSCGTDTPAGGLNTPCTRSSDCQGGLVCAGAVCVAIEAGGGDGGEAGQTRATDAAGAD